MDLSLFQLAALYVLTFLVAGAMPGWHSLAGFAASLVLLAVAVLVPVVRGEVEDAAALAPAGLALLAGALAGLFARALALLWEGRRRAGSIAIAQAVGFSAVPLLAVALVAPRLALP